MPGFDVRRPEPVMHRAPSLVAWPDRRQCLDRRSGPGRGGRRIGDSSYPMQLASPKLRVVARQTDWFGLWMAASKLQATFRQMRLHMF